MGGVSNVAQALGISTEMLKKFSSVDILTPYVRRLIKNRRLDSVAIAHLISKFDKDSQDIITDEVVSGRLTSEELKVLLPYSRKYPSYDVSGLISEVLAAKDKKNYLLFFVKPKVNIKKRALMEIFSKVIGPAEIVSISVINSLVSLKVTGLGLKILKRGAKEKKIPLRKYIDFLILS